MVQMILHQGDARTAALLDLACHQGAPALQAQVVNLDAYRITGLAEEAL